MELNKISTSFPRQLHRQSSSELSLSPGLHSYSTRDTTPEVVNNHLCQSLSSDIETTIPSQNSIDSSPSTSTTTSSAIAASPTFGHTTPFYHYANQARPDQRQDRMNFAQGTLRDHRTHTSPVNSYLPRNRESSNWRASPADLMDRATFSSSDTTPPPPSATTMDQYSFQQPQTNLYSPPSWPVTPASIATFPRTIATYTARTGFHAGGTGLSAPGAGPRLNLGDLQNQEFYGYGYDRGGGRITLLVPVDVIPPVAGIPQTLNDHSGIVILPLPPRRGPGGLSSNPNPLSFSNNSGVNGAGDQVQQYAANIRRPRPQSQIDSIIASCSSSSGAQPKRTKIYCDKWIHEGVCAFTQQGCKFKHEMPMDKATQHDLGLFQGLPSWWKKHQAELQRQHRQDEASDAPIQLTRSHEESPRDRSSHRGRHDIGTALTPPHSVASPSTSDSSPIEAPSGTTTYNNNPTIPSARRADEFRGLNGSRHNEALSGRSWSRIGELSAYPPSPYGPIGSPLKPGREMNNNQIGDLNRHSTLSTPEYVDQADRQSESTPSLI